MGKQYKKLTQEDITFIKEQKIFYMASCSCGEVNLSPKGYDSIRVLNSNSLLFMHYPGSGNRTHRDVSNDGEITLVFNAFVGEAKILRLFCKAEIINAEHEKFEEYAKRFGENPNVVRDFFIFNIYAVESSCGMSVPIMEYKEDRKQLRNWAVKMHKNGQLDVYNEKTFTPVDLSKVR